jgi:RES domain
MKLNLLEKILFHEFDKGVLPRFPVVRRSYPPNTNFFRVRSDTGIRGDLGVQDFWEPPMGGTKGRLNLQGERLLYAAHSPAVALAETKAETLSFENCLLIIYKSNYDIELTELGFLDVEKSTVYMEHLEKVNLVEGFVRRCFSGQSSGDFAYEISNLLGKKYFDYSEDGWCYSSINRSDEVCYCFRLGAKNKMKLIVGLRHGKDGYLDGLYVPDTDKIKSYHNFSTENSSGRIKYREIEAILKVQPNIDDLQQENRSTEPTLIYKMIKNDF